MTVQDYLQDLLKNSAQTELTITDSQLLRNGGFEDFIYRKLTSKKFRKTKMQDGCEERTRTAIKTKIKAEEPIRIIFPQGGYKLWRFPSSPEADWAEFFNIAYLLNYIVPIAAMYKPGVHLTYYMHTLLMEKHDNLTTQEIQAYVDSFQKLLDAFSEYLPKNIQIDILRDADIYKREEYFTALENGTDAALKTYENLPEEKKQAYKDMAELNIKWDGAEDWTNLSENEREEKLTMAAVYEMAAISELDKVTEAVKSSENVLVFTKATPQFIGIGSTKSSIAKYWVGFGVLVKKGEGYLPVILSPSQYETAMNQDFKKEAVSVVDGKNFSEIFVFDKLFRFNE